MSNVRSAHPPSRPVPRAYLALWMALAATAVLYLAVAMLRPATLAGLQGPWTATGGVPDDDQPALVAAADADLLKLREDVAHIGRAVADAAERDTALEKRIMAIEERIAAAEMRTSSVEPEPSVAPRSTAPSATPKPEPLAAKEAQKAAEMAAAATPTVINAPVAAPLETSSIPQPASIPTFGAPVVKPADRQVALDLGSAPSLDALRLSWGLVSELHGDTVKNLEPRYVTTDAHGSSSYRLVAGPLSSRAEAARVCNRLKAKGVPCQVGVFGGEAL